eukprot:415363_1
MSDNQQNEDFMNSQTDYQPTQTHISPPSYNFTQDDENDEFDDFDDDNDNDNNNPLNNLYNQTESNIKNTNTQIETNVEGWFDNNNGDDVYEDTQDIKPTPQTHTNTSPQYSPNIDNTNSAFDEDENNNDINDDNNQDDDDDDIDMNYNNNQNTNQYPQYDDNDDAQTQMPDEMEEDYNDKYSTSKPNINNDRMDDIDDDI